MDPDAKESPKSIPSVFQRRTLWSAITAVAIVVIGAIAVGAVMLTGTILSYLQVVLVPLAVAGIIAYLLEPVIRWLEKRGLSHGVAMLGVFIGFLVVIIVLAVAVFVPSFGQAQEAYGKWDTYQEQATSLVTKGLNSLQDQFDTGIAKEYSERGVKWISEEGPAIAADIGKRIWARLRGAFGFFGYVLGLLMVPIYLYYFLREGHKISQTWADYLPLRASKFKDEVVGTLTEVNGYVISFFRGQMVVSLIDGALVAIALSLLGLPYALLIGVFLAILGLIPYIGNLMVMIPALIIAIVHFGATAVGTVQGGDPAVDGEVAKVTVTETVGKKEVSWTDEKIVVRVLEDGKEAEVLVNAWTWLPNVWAYPLIVLLIFVILQQINGLVTAPKIVGDSVGLHPLTVIFSVLFWSLLLGGLLGALLAVPLTASIKVLFRRYIWERSLGAAVEARFSSTGSDDSDEIDIDVETDPDPEPA
ncbi:AI-2E family transporter [Verrucomicrobiales bacterium BCK34]|nr:AI-2E family transporter [Verrucomicrobiales bacterium BCK34]